MLGLRRAGATRYTVIAIILTTIAFLILLQAYHALYLGSRSDEFHLGSLGNVVLGGKPTKKPSKPVTLVVASVSATNTSWIQEYFPQHDHKIYIADDENAELTINLNKGRESAVYLTYIIDNYDNLPEISVFMHGGRYQWHNEDPLYDGAAVLEKLQFYHVMKEGFTTLRCTWQLGCPEEMHPDPTLEMHPDDPDLDIRIETQAAYTSAFQELFRDKPIPKAVGSHCGAQFAVTRDTIRKTKKSDYEWYRYWLWETMLNDDISGRVFEYGWHMIMGQPAVNCPDAATCFCQKFDLCDLDCKEYGCEKRYFFKYGNLPDGWPERGTGTEGWPEKDWFLRPDDSGLPHE